MSWYSVHAIFNINDCSKDPNKSIYEERLVLFCCGSEEEAYLKAIKSFEAYEVEFGYTMIGDCQVHPIEDLEIFQSSVVYSLWRESTLTNKEYYQTFFHTGKEFEQENTNEIEFEVEMDKWR